MTIKEIKNKEEWEDFILQQNETLFVQSWSYGEFYRSLGEEFWVFGLYANDKLIGGSLVLSTKAKRGNFLYLPYGPVFSVWEQEKIKCFNDFLIKFAKENHYDFIRVSPFIDDCIENKDVFRQNSYKDAPMHILAETTWILDLKDKSEEDLMKDMNKNHRNLIRRNIKEQVRIEKSDSLEALKDFNQLHDETAKRHNFHRFSDEYIKKEFEVFVNNKKAMMFKAYLPDGRLDSSAIVMYYGNMAAYRHGASLLQNNKIPTSYLIQWEAIKEALVRGMRFYNFWGIAPEEASPKHPFKGITHFKKGFGGFQKDLLHCQDLAISKKYWFNWGIEKVRRIKRGF